MTLASLNLGVDSNWATKPGKLLAYYKTVSKRYVPIELDFSRPSTATRVNEQGLIESVAIDEPRIDYSDGSAKLLLEPSRTNILLRSERFNTSPWQIIGLSINENATIAPNGTLTGNEVTVTSAVSLRLNQNITGLSAGTTYSFVVYAKKSSNGNTITLFVSNSGETVFSRRLLNLDTFVVQSSGSDNYPFTITANKIKNDWVKVNAIITIPVGQSTIKVNILPGNSLAPTTTGANVYIWGAQLEAGSYATSYIPTAGSAVTRLADSLVLSNAITNQWLSADEGTILDIIDNKKMARSYAADGSLQVHVNGYGYGSTVAAVPTSITYPIADIDKAQSIQLYPKAFSEAESIAATALGPEALLLDIFTGAAAAYSLRRLRTDYTGAAIRVRRSSDNVEADIGFNADGSLNTTALLAHVGANNGFVVTWYDQSGNARNATQATAANQPQIVSSGSVILENGQPALNSTTDSLIYAATTDDVSYTTFGVFKYNSTAVTQVAMAFDRFDLAMASPNFQLSDTGVKTITSYSNADVGIVQRLHAAVAIVSGGNATGTLFLNGVQKSTATTTLTSTRNGFSLFSDNTGNLRMNGTGQEFIIYPSDQSANRTAIESNINAYYNIY